MRRIRAAFLAAFHAALAAVDPEQATRWAVVDLGLTGPVRVVAIGKAAPGMARGAAAGCPVVGGVVVSDHPEEVPADVELVLGSHPYPDDRSLAAGEAAWEEAARASEEETLLVLVSGGGSALAELPVEGMDVGELAVLQRRLMAAGTPIGELNTVRRHLSRLKNGGLARAAGAGRVVTLLVSDVVGAPLSAIASGPTMPDGSTPADALAVIRRRLGEVPPAVEGALGTREPETTIQPHEWRVVADGPTAVRAAAASLEASGLDTEIVTTELQGEARVRALDLIGGTPPGAVRLAGGETTVTVTGGGVGGRNQEAALAAALEIDGVEAVFAALGTDGIDGPTDAAGAIVDGGTAGRIRAAGLSQAERLAANDSYPALAAAGDLVVTGPTGCNVGDLWMWWRGSRTRFLMQ